MTEIIKQRIEKIRQGEIPDGYKKTKVGIVPEEWIEESFSNLFESTSNYTEDLSKYPLYSLTIEDGIVEKTEKYERSHLVKKENSYKIVRPNDFAYNPMNVRFGAVARHKRDKEVSISGYYDIFTTVIKSDLEFMDSFLVSDKMITYYNKVATGSLVEKQRVHFSQFIEFMIPLPKREERKEIAEVLKSQNKLIELKIKLIEEKRRQKKHLMQQLLTGKKRLPGFDSEWKLTKLKKHIYECAEKNTEKSISNILSVSNRSGFVAQEEQFGKRVASDDISKYKIVSQGCIAYNPSRINVGSIAYYSSNDFGVISPMYVVFKTEKTLCPDYFMALTKTNEFFQQMKILLAGSVRDSLKFDDLCSMTFKLPSIEEQKAIAKILLTADKEIELLQQDLEQEKQKKKALMQLLLTGIVRVEVNK